MVSKVLVRALTISASSPLSPRGLHVSLSCHLYVAVFILLFTFFGTILFQKRGRKTRIRKRRKRREEEPVYLWGEENEHSDPLQRESGKLTFSVLQLLRPRLFTTATFPSSTCCSLRSCSFICRASWIALVTASWSFK